MKKLFPIGVIFVITFIFFWQFIIKGLMPIPADTIVGLYYPFRDIYSKTNPSGVPFKNFLITDPVRQQYPWRSLSVDLEKTGQLPIWNPYNFAGTPLMQNSQTAAFYPLNILFFLVPFATSWSLLIFLGPLLGGIFMYLYLNNLKLNKISSILGAIAFSFCGFSVAWMEWGSVLNTALWLPLILLSIDKIDFNKKISRSMFFWAFIFIFSLVSSYLAGHLQIFFYVLIFTFFYILGKIIMQKNEIKTAGLFLFLFIISALITSFQWLPTLKFIFLSARNVDVENFTTPGWFIPWQNIIQLLIPDFFGNPTTLNYWGVWNYAEFSSYVGILPLIMSFFALFFRKDKKTLFFGLAFFLSLIFALPTFFAKLPFELQIPFFLTSQPTRLLFITDFSLAVLAGFGLDYFIKQKNRKQLLYILGIFSVIFSTLWFFISFPHGNLISIEKLRVSKQNLIFPTVIFFMACTLLLTIIFYPKNRFKEKIQTGMFYLFIIITVVDLFRFGWKFESFTKSEYLFPETSVITFLQNQKQPFRVMSTDSRILPPNFSIMYKIQTLDGYDPLYIRRYGELIAAMERNNPDINPPFGFNRIITPHNYESRIIDLLGVKYVLGLSVLNSPKLKKVFQEGQTIVYENKKTMPRSFFVKNVKTAEDKKRSIDMLFDPKIDITQTGIVENVNEKLNTEWSVGSANIAQYSENKIIIETLNRNTGFLVLTDTFYPTWYAEVDSIKTKIYITDFNFRGIIVPSGKHQIVFSNSLF